MITMKKFLSLILAALMLLSVACAEEVVPSVTTDVVVGGVPSGEVVLEDAVATENLFVGDESEAAVAAVDAVLAAAQNAATPVEAYTADTQTAVTAALEADADKIVVAAAPVAINVNADVAADATAAQILTLANVTVNEKFVIVVTLTTAGVVEEIVLTSTAVNAEANEVYASIDLDTLAKIQAADTAVVTVLTVAQ